MSEKNKKSYYAIIPANVRYDKELTANSKLLYGEITALCNEKGYCWAGDTYFTNLYGVSKSTIQRWFKQLEDKGYIYRKVIYEDGTRKIKHRYTYLWDYPIPKNETTPIPKNGVDNNTLYNTTVNNTKEYSAFFEKVWKLYPNKRGKGRVSVTQKKKLCKVVYEELKRCIERYIKDLEKDKNWRNPQNGSTFFNSGYIDYLDENYKEVPNESRTKDKTNNGKSREKSLNELIKEELKRQGRTSL